MIVYSNFNQGRLGNQLFFVASTMGIATKNNTEWGFTSQLGHSGINYQMMFKNKLPITPFVPEQKYHQSDFGYYDINIDNVELIGYFQSEKYFLNCESKVREQFKFNDDIIKYVVEKYPQINESLSIHIRRGDYVQQPNHHPLVPLSYYKNILNEIYNNYDNIFIFSDDIDWVKENFIDSKFIFPYFENNNDINSFVLLSQSKDFVISNSTYSWWASWLSNNTEKKVYCPNNKHWFGPSLSHLNTNDLIPKSWIIYNNYDS